MTIRPCITMHGMVDDSTTSYVCCSLQPAGATCMRMHRAVACTARKIYFCTHAMAMRWMLPALAVALLGVRVRALGRPNIVFLIDESTDGRTYRPDFEVCGWVNHPYLQHMHICFGRNLSCMSALVYSMSKAHDTCATGVCRATTMAVRGVGERTHVNESPRGQRSARCMMSASRA